MSSTQPHEEPQQAVEAHEEEDYGSDLANDDIQEVVPEHDRDGDMPMDDESDEEGAQQDNEGPGPGQEEFVDNSIAAFYSHRKSVFSVSLHPSFPNPPLALSGGEDDAGWIWNTQDGSEVVRLGGHTDSVTSALFNAAGDLAATGGMDGKVRIWRKRSDDFKSWNSSPTLKALMRWYGSTGTRKVAF